MRAGLTKRSFQTWKWFCSPVVVFIYSAILKVVILKVAAVQVVYLLCKHATNKSSLSYIGSLQIGSNKHRLHLVVFLWK